MGVGLWPLVLTFGLLSPSSGGISGGRGSSDRADVLICFPGMCSASGPPCGGESCVAAVLCPSARVHERAFWTLGGASGALQVVAQVPEAMQ